MKFEQNNYIRFNMSTKSMFLCEKSSLMVTFLNNPSQMQENETIDWENVIIPWPTFFVGGSI